MNALQTARNSGVFKWLDDNSIVNVKWAASEPQQLDNDCVSLVMLNTGNLLYDDPCYVYVRPVVCEKRQGYIVNLNDTNCPNLQLEHVVADTTKDLVIFNGTLLGLGQKLSKLEQFANKTNNSHLSIKQDTMEYIAIAGSIVITYIVLFNVCLLLCKRQRITKQRS